MKPLNSLILIIALLASCDTFPPEVNPLENSDLALRVYCNQTTYTEAYFAYVINTIPDFEGYKAGICYDTLPEPKVNNQTVIIDTIKQQFTELYLNNLIPDKSYFARSFIQVNEKVIYSDEIPFQTQSALPYIYSYGVQDIKTTGLTYEIYFNTPNGYELTRFGAYLGQSNNLVQEGTFSPGIISNQKILITINNLQPDTEYLIQAVIANNQGEIYGRIQRFRTLN